MTDDAAALVARARDGDRVAIAKLLTMVEVGGERARAAIAATAPHTGNAWTVGITGAPGAGKSTLTDALVKQLRACDIEVGVLAVDPTSPFSGGAILGDRVRMQDHSTDPGVFIRSMATRGHLGGLALATPLAVRVLDAAKKQWVLIETVGVGQVEVEIAGHADSTVVVVNPGWGDGVQAAKAGLLEVADVFVVNKADRPGARETRRDLDGMLDLGGLDEHQWRPPIVETVATEGTGVAELRDALRAHRDFLEAHDLVDARRRTRVRDELRAIVAEQLRERAAALGSGAKFDALVDRVAARELDPFAAASELLA
ncbi:MAG TPA: methylmalonyl Co-A mutase-associated GTPase MeaB [Acidimicrobiia bacterium]|jgi:LAO/AO transport system kinase|nr:methylmalonyl Co-A mutase-associated GTPase MeaB [Acidimicrobiia bacterium]